MPNPNFPNNPGYNLYVGARYVPLFANPIEWDMSKTYEPLTIVTYQGNSYTSKTFVPANTQITNTTYWALTGNYDAQVEQYRQEVINYAQQSQAYFDITNILSLYFRGKNILIIGASNETPSYSWAYKLKTALNGIANVTINAVNGRTLTGSNGGANVFVNNVNNYDIVIMAVLRNDYWENVPLSGDNDADTYDTIAGALFQMYANGIVSNNAYNKKVFFLSMFFGYSNTEATYATLHYPWTVYNKSLQMKCNRYGFKFVNANKFAGAYSANDLTGVTTDGRHFNETAQQNIFENVLRALISENFDDYVGSDKWNMVNAITMSDGYTLNNAQMIANENEYELLITFSPTSQMNADASYNIGTIPEDFSRTYGLKNNGLFIGSTWGPTVTQQGSASTLGTTLYVRPAVNYPAESTCYVLFKGNYGLDVNRTEV